MPLKPVSGKEQRGQTKETLRDVRDIVVNDLDKNGWTSVRGNVKDLSLDASRLHGRPLEVGPGRLGIRRLLSLLGDGEYSRRPILGLLGTGHIGESITHKQSVSYLTTGTGP